VKAGSRFRFIAALLSVLAATAVAGVLIYQTAFNTLRHTFREMLDRSATQGVTIIDGYIQSQFAQLSLFASFPSVQQGRLDELRPGIEDPKRPTTRFRSMAVIGADGRGVSTNGSVFEAAGTRYFQEALAGKHSLSGPFVSHNEDLPTMVFAMPVSGEHPKAAVVTSAVDLTVFRLLLESIRTLSGAQFTLVQNDGSPVVSSDPIAADGDLIETQLPLGDVPWTLKAQVGVSEIMAPVRTVLLVVGFLVIAAAAFIVVFFLIGFSHRRHLDEVREDRTQALRDAYEQIRKLAFHDAVTRLPNRILAMRKLGEALQAESRLVVAIVALSRFRSLTTTFGITFGDAVLKDAASRLSAFAGEEGFVAKLSGSEFLLLLDEKHFETGMGAALLDRLKEPMGHEGLRLHVGVHVGVCRMPEAGETPDEIIKSAETAVWAAREKGHDQYTELTADAVDHRLRRAQLQKLLPLGLERDEFEMHYQPQVDVKTGRVIGYEGLLRWHSPDLGPVPPIEFIPLAEETGFILPLGYWVLEQGLSFARTLADRGSEAVVSVNVSAVQFLHDGFIEEVERLVIESGVPYRNIGLEITESTLIEGVARLRPSLSRIMERGVKVSLDDFGTGYSSLNYLKELPLHVLKIDKSFIEALSTDTRALPLIDGIVQIAHRLGLSVVAEGVETADQLAALSGVGCDLVQGFFIGEPRPTRHYVEAVTV
jgi:diguanylate cyclase (GGDEF)-like protein